MIPLVPPVPTEHPCLLTSHLQGPWNFLTLGFPKNKALVISP